MKYNRLTKVESLLLLLERPAKLFLSEQELPDLPIRAGNIVTTRPSFPLWPACADILFNSQSRIFVGLSYSIHENSRNLVRNLCNGLPDEIVRYNDITSHSLAKPYIEYDLEVHRLEIIWTNIYADSLEIAQLDSGFWYYANNSVVENHVVAFGLTYISEILDDYGLVLPSVFVLPFFAPEFRRTL